MIMEAKGNHAMQIPSFSWHAYDANFNQWLSGSPRSVFGDGRRAEDS